MIKVCHREDVRPVDLPVSNGVTWWELTQFPSGLIWVLRGMFDEYTSVGPLRKKIGYHD